MSLREYFGEAKGHGILASADSDGKVDVAVYALPYVADDETIAFIVADKLTRKNLLANPHAAFLYMEPGGEFKGKRLFLRMEKELRDDEVTDRVLAEKYKKACQDYSDETLSVIYFKVGKVLPLVGDTE